MSLRDAYLLFICLLFLAFGSIGCGSTDANEPDPPEDVEEQIPLPPGRPTG